MKHVIAGAGVAGVFVGIVLVWALLGHLMGPEWALTIMLLAAIFWMAASIFDYITERSQ